MKQCVADLHLHLCAVPKMNKAAVRLRAQINSVVICHCDKEMDLNEASTSNATMGPGLTA